MKLEVNKVYSGFIVKHAEYVEEVQSEAYLMEHEKKRRKAFISWQQRR